jgi:two-component system chemotaxis response regulator CheY
MGWIMNKPVNILIVDDVDFSRELLRSALLASIKDSDFPLDPNFFQVSNGKNIIETIQRRKIEIVYLDIDLPDESGLELLKSIKKIDSRITVVMVSGEGSSANVMEAIKSGANGFIVKPFNTGRINESLENHLKKGKK